MNVKFIQLTAAKFSAVTYDASKHQGLFIHLTEDVKTGEKVTTPAGLYFGGTTGWEMLSNSTYELDGDAAIATIADGVVTLKAGVTEVDGVISQAEGDDITLAKVATTGKAEDITFAQFPEETSEEPLIANGANLQEVMEAVVESINDTNADSVVALYDKDGKALSGDAAEVKADGTTYTLKQGTGDKAKVVAKFNIVKDSFVKSGSVVYGTLTDGVFTPGTAAKDGSNAYIELQLATRTDGTDTTEDLKTIYIPAASLIEYSSVADGDLYLAESEDHVISVTEKVEKAIKKVEGLEVNGQTVDEEGKVTISASDIKYNGTSDAESDDVTVEQALDDLKAEAYKGVENAEADQYVKVSEVADNKQTLSVEIGSFTVPATADTEEVAQKKGLATVEDVEKVITDNEKVTSNALNELNSRIKVLEDVDPVNTSVAGDEGTSTGVKVNVNLDESTENERKYTVAAELVWLDVLE